jgi:hypothetical protein
VTLANLAVIVFPAARVAAGDRGEDVVGLFGKGAEQELFTRGRPVDRLPAASGTRCGSDSAGIDADRLDQTTVNKSGKTTRRAAGVPLPGDPASDRLAVVTSASVTPVGRVRAETM